ncbi:hypothetical protein SPHINGOAX6_50293 [Sphingomonas sp. AX6]|nr:hypothetical protein SPHINGOAX6_50293 [Sphingomonas sp. AX6]
MGVGAHPGLPERAGRVVSGLASGGCEEAKGGFRRGAALFRARRSSRVAPDAHGNFPEQVDKVDTIALFRAGGGAIGLRVHMARLRGRCRPQVR